MRKREKYESILINIITTTFAASSSRSRKSDIILINVNYNVHVVNEKKVITNI